MQSALETRFGVAVGDTELQKIETIGELKNMLKASGPAEEAAGTAVVREQHVYPRWPWTWLASAVRVVFLEGVAMPLVACLAAPRVVREAGGEPEEPLLIVANHVTMFDVPILLYGLSGHMRRRVAVAMAGEMLLDWRHARNQGNWFLNLLAPATYYLVTGLFNVFPLPQAGDFRASFAHAGRAMDRGFHVLVFPEGRRTTDGRVHAFQRGSGLLWKELECAALPVYLEGLWELQAAGKGWFRSGRIRVHVGSAMALPAEADPAAATALLDKGVRGLKDG